MCIRDRGGGREEQEQRSEHHPHLEYDELAQILTGGGKEHTKKDKKKTKRPGGGINPLETLVT